MPSADAQTPQLLHGFFTRTLGRFPDAVAVDVPPGPGRPQRRSVPYAALAAKADALAARLRPRITAPDRIVALLLPRDTEALAAAQIATLTCGAAYVGIDPSFPDEHVRRILDDATPVALVGDAAGARRALTLGLSADQVVDVDDRRSPPSSGPAETPAWLTPQHLAYLIYTSGTTGAPKGVMISHESIVNLVRSDDTHFDLRPGDRVAQGSSSAYDSSVEEIWMTLASGATIVPMDDATARLGPDLVDWLRRERITVLCPPPTLLRATGCADPRAALPDLRLLYVGGEPLPRDVADLWAPGRRLVNGYGPTECTVTALRADIVAGADIVVGTPVDGLSAHILDDALEAVPDGARGELCLGGVGVARGYRNRPELTAEKFVAHPRWGRLYRTGDLARRLPDGAIACDGRIDSQVKLRGYRIELEAIEAALARQDGVREAACRLQATGGREELIGFVVPDDPAAPPDPGVLRDALAAQLPFYMVPARFAFLADLPRTVGGKVRREQLPLVDLPVRQADRPAVAPRTPAEAAVAAAVGEVLESAPVSVEDDFFTDLGGTSLLAARLVSRLRADPSTAAVAVRDIYEARTVAGIARRALPAAAAAAGSDAPPGNPLLVTAIQTLWLLFELLAGSAVGAAVALGLLPEMLRRLGVVGLLLAGPVLAGMGLVLYAPLSVLWAVAVKRALIGRYAAGRAPVWSGFAARHWIVRHAVGLIPWGLFSGTEITSVVLRLLGARVGRRAHFHRGAVPLSGGWDLLTLGDDVTLCQEASLRLVDLDAGHLVSGPIVLGDGATVGVRAGLAPNTAIARGGSLGPLASLPGGSRVPEGARWDGVPARPAGRSPEAPPLPTGARSLSPAGFAAALCAARTGLAALDALPLEALLVTGALVLHVDTAEAARRLSGAAAGSTAAVAALLTIVALPVSLALKALAARAMGTVAEGVVGVRSLEYLRVWLKSGLVDSAGRWLSGSLFWPWWLRAAGMRVGTNCEISTIIDVVPELVEIASDTFLADGIYLGPPELHRGVARLGRVRLSRNTFVGNHAVLPAGQSLPEDILLGVCTVADPRQVRPGSSWFGLPAFELPRREVVECDRSLTHTPSPARYATRLFWESLRFAVPAVPVAATVSWFAGLGLAGARLGTPALLAAGAPLVGVGVSAGLAGAVLALKWLLLGRVRPGTHPLWSCWCSRWDFLYVAWTEWALPVLTPLEGTLWLNVYLRAMGMKIGRRVALSGGFSQVVDPDMIEIGDDATVSAIFQAHTFEDRVLKIDTIRIGRGATLGAGTVPLYGAAIGDRARVAPHSVVMKDEILLPGVGYEGAPTRPESRSPAP